MSQESATQSAPATERFNGSVKWFNNNLNYGFVTVITEGEHLNRDVFVHQSNIRSNGYRTLQTGEYVSFVLSPNDDEAHPLHATDVTGISGGKLLCDYPRRLPSQIYNRGSYNNRDGHSQDGHPQDGHRRDGHRRDGHRRDGPRRDGPHRDGPRNRGGPRNNVNRENRQNDQTSSDNQTAASE